MSKKRNLSQTEQSIWDVQLQHHYRPVGCILCQDVLIENNGNISFFRLVDFVAAPLPVHLQLWLIAEFAYNPLFTHEQFIASNTKFELRLKNPLGKIVVIGEATPNPPEQNKPALFFRMVMNLSGMISFENEGTYEFLLYETSSTKTQELVISRPFFIRKLAAPPDSGETARSGEMPEQKDDHSTVASKKQLAVKKKRN